MGPPTAGAVVLVPFPFSDLSGSRLRPAIVMAGVSRGDFVLCQITSNPYSDSAAIEIADEHFRSGSLRAVSYARPGKLFTAHETLIKSVVGHLTSEAFRRTLDAVLALLDPPTDPKT